MNRVSSDIPRARFTPEEVVSLTLDFYRRNYIEGLFLSSGVIQSPDYTMEQLVAVARALLAVSQGGPAPTDRNLVIFYSGSLDKRVEFVLVHAARYTVRVFR